MSKPKTVYTPTGEVFVIGGSDLSDKPTNKCFQYRNKELFEIPPMSQPRISYGCCVTPDYIYIAGGCGSKLNALSACEAYSIHTGKWE